VRRRDNGYRGFAQIIGSRERLRGCGRGGAAATSCATFREAVKKRRRAAAAFPNGRGGAVPFGTRPLGSVPTRILAGARLIHLKLRISSQPFLDMARSLQEAGYPPETTIILRRDDQIALLDRGRRRHARGHNVQDRDADLREIPQKGEVAASDMRHGPGGYPSASIANDEPGSPALYLSPPSTAGAQDAPANEHEPSSENHR
jgi:hypothetical protein